MHEKVHDDASLCFCGFSSWHVSCFGRQRLRGANVAARRYERYNWVRKARWDFFTAGNGGKSGYVTNISKGGCLLKTTDLIEHRRWIRILIHDGQMAHTAIGRVIRCEHAIEAVGDDDISLYRYGVEFVQPCFASTQDLDLILALSNKNWTVRSCLSLNTKSS
jgi:hypothetical protein